MFYVLLFIFKGFSVQILYVPKIQSWFAVCSFLVEFDCLMIVELQITVSLDNSNMWSGNRVVCGYQARFVW